MTRVLGIAAVVLGIACAWWFAGADSPAAAPATAPSTQAAKEMTLDLGGKVALKLVQIPAGKFLMGSPETEKGRNADETQHEVTITKPFNMGTSLVTVDQFAAFVKDSSYKTDAEKEGESSTIEISGGNLFYRLGTGVAWRNPGFDQKGDYPVLLVSWNDAQAFCAWLSKKSGKTVVLPTEAQLEYACRAGTKTAYPWGDNPDDGKGFANCGDQSLKKKLPKQPHMTYFSWDDGFVLTSPVTSFKPNAFGLYDMTGNASQWCQDRYGPYEKAAASDPTGATKGDLRVLHGGSWYSSPKDCRAASRGFSKPTDRLNLIGFRVVVTGE